MRIIISALPLFLVALVPGCAFKPHIKVEATAPIKLEVLEAQYDWNQTDKFRLGAQSKASRKLVQVEGSLYKADWPVTLPESVPSPLYIVATLPSLMTEAIVFTKAKVKIGERTYQLKTSYVLNDRLAKSITFEVAGLETAFEQSISQEGSLLIEMFNDQKKLLEYSFALRTPASNVAFEILDVQQAVEDLALSQAMVAPEAEGIKAGMIKILKITNKESLPIDVQIPKKLTAELSQQVTRQNYLDRECHGGDFKYWPSQWKDVYSSELTAVLFDENFVFSLSELRKADSTILLSVHIDANDIRYVAFYSVSEKGWQLASGNPVPSTASVQHVPAGCWKLPAIYRDDTTRRYFKDLLIGDSRGDLAIKFPENVRAGVRFSDLRLSSDFELRILNCIPAGFQGKL